MPATITYDPVRGNMRNVKWWCVARLDKEITRYYRWWIKTQLHIDLQPPAWDAHISIIRGEEPSPNKKHLWGRYEGETVNVSYFPNVQVATNSKFWIIECTHPLFVDIRKEFAFKSDWLQHITVGKMRDGYSL